MTTVLFDLDGTLHDRATGLRLFVADRARHLAVGQESREQFARRFLELDAKGSVWKDRVYDQLRQEFDSSKWPSTEDLVKDYVQTFPGFAVETPGSTDLLTMLNRHGVTVVILTNGRSDLQRSVIEALGFGSLVSSVVVSEETGFRKPQREIFDIALASVAGDPAGAIMVGDDPVSDIDGAQRAGILPIAFRCVPTGPVVIADDMQAVGHEILKHVHGAAGAAHRR